jgi:hypothetical protein
MKKRSKLRKLIIPGMILLINLTYCGLLLNHTKSLIYKLHKANTEEILQQYDIFNKDTKTYVDMPPKDNFRTVGYPYLLRTLMKLDHWYIIMLMFNCLLGAWMFYVVYQLIDKRALILAGLGAFTIYVPMLLTDLLFASLFITTIWKLKKKQFWFAMILMGLASLVRPSLAWFFLVIPAVMYFYGYRKVILYISLPITFIVTAFNPVRNYVNNGQWTHSTVLKHNIESDRYFTGDPKYFIKSFKSNFLSGHYDYIGGLFSVYKRDHGHKQARIYMWWSNLVCVLINTGLWLRFGYRLIKRKASWGDVIILGYFVLPTLFAATGSRLRLPVEWILLM